eukprot:TRINITY_DN103537_c0_g1_i1.p1 TRINITY_DN103537_c0_g1~~TRINITY_DN103537_c0_g1_i1.p1  ORF type:complete len:780 (+),score=44.62 TRINITY_DN103537_c0_g1_i1:46-2385(+)
MDTGNTKHGRVKLYVLNQSDGAWEDKGTGHVEITKSENPSAEPAVEYSMVMTSEKETDANGESVVLLNTRVVNETDIYQKQGETLIVWNDPWLQQELALSFQAPAGAQQLWRELLAAQGRTNPEEDELQPVSLPPPEVANLEQIHAALTTATFHDRPRLCECLLSEGYLKQLFELHSKCEQTQDTQSLYRLFEIFKAMVLLNSLELLQTLFHEDNIMSFIATLEHDPSLSTNSHSAGLQHREYLQNKVVHKKVIDVPAELNVKIHNTFKLQYIRDTVLARCLDDPTFSTISSLLIHAQCEILSSLYNDNDFLQSLFERLQDESEDLKREATSFLQEMVTLSKSLPLQQKRSFFGVLTSRGFPTVLADSMNCNDTAKRLVVADVLWQATIQDSTSMKKYATSPSQADQTFPFLKTLAQQIIREDEGSVQSQLTDVIKCLLEGEVFQADTITMLNIFYEHIIPVLIAPLLQDTLNPIIAPNTMSSLMEVLTFCVSNHTYRMKQVVIREEILCKTMALIQRPQCPVHLILSAVRLLKAVILCKDDFYNKHIIQHNLIAPVVELFAQNGVAKYNLVNSAVLSLFECMRRENIKSLITYVVEKFPDSWDDVKYVETFTQLQQKFVSNANKDSKPKEDEADPSWQDLLQSEYGGISQSEPQKNQEQENDTAENGHTTTTTTSTTTTTTSPQTQPQPQGENTQNSVENNTGSSSADVMSEDGCASPPAARTRPSQLDAEQLNNEVVAMEDTGSPKTPTTPTGTKRKRSDSGEDEIMAAESPTNKRL